MVLYLHLVVQRLERARVFYLPVFHDDQDDGIGKQRLEALYIVLCLKLVYSVYLCFNLVQLLEEGIDLRELFLLLIAHNAGHSLETAQNVKHLHRIIGSFALELQV